MKSEREKRIDDVDEVLVLLKDVIKVEDEYSNQLFEVFDGPCINKINGKELYRCDVCWTCRFFNPLNSECSFSIQGKISPIDFTKRLYSGIELTPSSFRCGNWEDVEK